MGINSKEIIGEITPHIAQIVVVEMNNNSVVDDEHSPGEINYQVIDEETNTTGSTPMTADTTISAGQCEQVKELRNELGVTFSSEAGAGSDGEDVPCDDVPCDDVPCSNMVDEGEDTAAECATEEVGSGDQIVHVDNATTNQDVKSNIEVVNVEADLPEEDDESCNVGDQQVIDVVEDVEGQADQEADMDLTPPVESASVEREEEVVVDQLKCDLPQVLHEDSTPSKDIEERDGEDEEVKSLDELP